jgi:epoxide hydrolase
MSAQVTPFHIAIDDAVLTDLRDRLGRTRWPERETVDDWSQGIPLAYVQDLCEYWRTSYDWRSREARLNQFPQVKVSVSGGGPDALEIHAIHARSAHPGAVPLVLTHGWPGSTVEFMNCIAPLVDPVAYGGSADDAFHVVAPSLPGFGFSEKPQRHGWKVDRIARAWDELMAALDYDRYIAQGGDWGSSVTMRIGSQNLGRCIAIHTNMPFALPAPEDMAELDADELTALGQMQHYSEHESGYAKQQSTRPQTLGYGLVDSPAAQCAWIVEKFRTWTDNDGSPEHAISRDELLDNVMLYWLSGAGASSARIYWESLAEFAGARVELPAGASLYPKEIFNTPRKWMARVFPDLRHWGVLERGGHFAAFEEPDLFVDEIRAFARTVR